MKILKLSMPIILGEVHAVMVDDVQPAPSRSYQRRVAIAWKARAGGARRPCRLVLEAHRRGDAAGAGEWGRASRAVSLDHRHEGDK